MLAGPRRLGKGLRSDQGVSGSGCSQLTGRAARKGSGSGQNATSLCLPTHELLLALDVEFVHCKTQGRQQKHAAEVCLVDSKLQVTYHSYIRPDVVKERKDRQGGVLWELLCSAPAAHAVRQELQEAIEGKLR